LPPEALGRLRSPRFFLIPLFPERRSLTVKAFSRGLCSAFVAVSLLGVAGCGPDNESEGQALNKKIGDPGAPAANSKSSEVTPPAKTQQDHFKQVQAGQDYMKKEGTKKKN
jgi:hypothetical protein